EKAGGEAINDAKARLAHEVTAMIHGKEEADKVQEAARSVYGGSGSSEDMPTTELTEEDLTNGYINVSEMLVKAKLCASRSDGRRLIQQGGLTIDGERITNEKLALSGETLLKGIIIRKGKKIFHRVMLKN
ncbi:MAG: tyrosine--tRNA ligase, partial [Clostridia bacterium]|nr:tyrosine--tRNA ligase [Clostridia bacterium]